MKVVAIIFTLFCISASAQLTYEKMYTSVSTFEGLSDLIITSDGNYIVLGAANLTTPTYSDVRLCKLNPAGNILWNHVYAAPVADSPARVKETHDNGFIISIATNSFSSGIMAPGLMKTDSTGNLLWSRVYPAPGNYFEFVSDVIQTADYGFALIGSGYDSLPEAMIIKTDSAGNLAWKKYYHGNHIDNFTSAAQLSNGDILAVGSTRSFPGPVYKVLLTRLDTAGNVKWSRVYAASSNEFGMKIISADDSAIVIGGHTSAHTSGLTDFFIMVLDTAGAFQWAKAYGGSITETLHSGRRTPDKGFLLAGATNSFLSGGLIDVYAIGADSMGNLTWAKHFGHSNNSDERAYSIYHTPDNGSIIGCFSNYIYLIKTDSMGNSFCNAGSTTTTVTPYSTSDSTVSLSVISVGTAIAGSFTTASGLNENQLCSTGNNETFSDETTISFFPNPLSSSAIIAVHPPSESRHLQLHIYDVTGRQVRTVKLEPGATKLERGNLSSGIYFYSLRDEEKQIATGKFAAE